MTQEEAIKKIKAWDFLDNDEKEILETLIPELQESEDERISREITEFILTHRIDEPNDIEDTNPWLAWLEKQGKPKWTEEDDKRQISITEYLNELYDDNRFSLNELTELETWLNSLKQRIGGQ